MRYGIVVFDFDGTLVDSNLLKLDGFSRVFADRPECLPVVRRVLDAQKSASRNEIISCIAAHMAGLTAAQREDEIRRRTNAYTTWVEERIVQKATRSPAGRLLKRWHRQAPLYLCSLTPAEPLRRILEKLDWLRYFCGVAGYPVSKEEMLRKAVSRHGLRPEEAVMVGDSDNDEAAATAAGTQFFRIRKIPDLLKFDREFQP